MLGGRHLVGSDVWEDLKDYIASAESDDISRARSLKEDAFLGPLSPLPGNHAGRSLMGPESWKDFRAFIDSAERDDDIIDRAERDDTDVNKRSLMEPLEDIGEDMKAPKEGKRSLAEESPGIQGLPVEGTTASKKRSLLAEGRER